LSREKSPEEANGPQLVKDIFERRQKTPEAAKKISALFGGNVLRQPSAKTAEKKKLTREYFPVGIDMGGSDIKIAQMAKVDGQVELVKAARARFSGQSHKGAVRQLVGESGFKGESVVGLSAKEAQIRVLSLPPMPAAEVEGAVSWQIAEGMGIDPRKMADFSVDYTVLSESDKGFSREKKVLVAVVRKDVVMDKIQEISEAGLDVIAVEPGPLAFFAAVCRFLTPDEAKLTIFLDIGYDNSSLSIAIGQDIYFVGDVTTTGNLMTEAIKDYFQIDYGDAEELKLQYGLEDWASVPETLAKSQTGSRDVSSLRPALASGLENLIVDIEHSYKSLSNQLVRSGTEDLSRIIICGGGAKLKGIESFLRGPFNIPVEAFNPLNNILIDDELISRFNNIKEAGLGFGTAIGLSLRNKEEEVSR
jgi:type IV pilus assembly protein PilM